MMADVFNKLNQMSFSDKMGVTQRMFVAIEDYERQQMQIQVLVSSFYLYFITCMSIVCSVPM